MLMMRHSAGNVGRELQREVARVSTFRALDKHYGRLTFPFQDDGFSDVAWRCAYQRHVAVDHEEFASVRAGVQEYQMLRRRVFAGRLRVAVAAALATGRRATTIAARSRRAAAAAAAAPVLVHVVERALHRVEVRQIATLELEILEAGPHVDAAVKLPETLLPWIRVLGLVGRDELEFTRGWIEQRQVIFVDLLVQRLPQLRVVGDRLETLADLRDSAQVLLHEIVEYREQYFVG